ncbi:HAMP domain-containing sensor histidine kinase [Paraburkholderia sp. BL25I1N1]|uniref:sensor histidine kinase n=1 Tax=Paraburkholderia sp. BL25I1N1 TaxID=1938804 RepID=UPI0015E5E2B9|nr:HAMP domain-containing sensor histidine kinase [Paraburkholderia sp. BL25I1N1]
MVEIAPETYRQPLASAVRIPAVTVDWYPENSGPARVFATSPMDEDEADLAKGFEMDGHPRRLFLFESDTRLPSGLRYDRAAHPHAYFLAVELRDRSWIVFIATRRLWGLSEPAQIAIALSFVAVSILAASALATHYLSRPIRRFAEELRTFGGDPRAGPVREAGPRELRAAIAAFNALQAQLRKFVEDRTAMLAAMSHDLRTPLTKIRLRGEFIEDEDQRARLFRDVDDLQAMADSALSFFRDDFKDEEPTVFDFAGLLRAMADDYGDHGKPVSYMGPDRLAFSGRPFSLRRACMNLVDNALKYGDCAELELHRHQDQISIKVSDRGPGIPPHAFDQVFVPFFRLERSRNRMTGGMGLGLTSARAVVRAHGGDIVLSNRRGGGLEVSVTLPINL